MGGESTVIICGEPTKETSRKPIGVRWCFNHRGRSEFHHVVRSPIGMSYYDPMPHIECSECGQIDGDIGFGGCREWE